ncbi:hypothetical protein FRC02_003584 [Tulasnella sp. 418]|nr:hypothetical protein FRC02_003584 [Tulasnella sp. 418]
MLEATRKSGIRSYFCYARVDQFPYGAKRKEWQMAHLEKLVKEGMGSDRVTLGLAFDHSDDGFFNELKDELFPFADKHGIDIFSTNYLGGPNPIGEGGVHAFASRGFLENRSILFVHANSLQSSEHELLRNSSSAVVSTPEIEQSMALGPTVGFPAEDAGVRVGLGVDCACAVGGNMFRVMRSMLAYQRGHENQEILKKGKVPLKLQRRTKDVFRMATIGGARAIRREHEIGTLEVGKKADIVLINATSPSMLGAARDPVRAIVMHATVEDVNKVIVGGEVLVDKSRSSRDGVFTRLNWSDEVNKVRNSLARISSTFKNQEHEEEEAFKTLQESLPSMGVNFVGAGDR